MKSKSSVPKPFPVSHAWLLDNPLGRAQAGRILGWLRMEPGMRVVDVGCGPGRLTLPVAGIVGGDGEVLAVDLQPAMLTIVERRATAEGLQNIRTVEAAAGSGALPAERFDLALLSFVLGEIPAERRQAAIQEVALALRPGAALAFPEGTFAPHRQSREAVLALVDPAGLRLQREDRRLTSALYLFRKPSPTSVE